MHIMIDLETMGNTPDAPIVAIGACRFDKNGVSEDTFYQKVSLESAVESGAKMDASTVIWWMKQSDEARKEITSGKDDLWEVLCDFTAWVRSDDDLSGVWGNGAAFDNVILTQTYRRMGQKAPWPFWLDRCYRTMKSLSDVELVRSGTHHHALDDAVTQAKHLIAIWEAGE